MTFDEWWKEFQAHPEFLEMTRRDLAIIAYGAGLTYAVAIEERVREERNRLAEHLRNVTIPGMGTVDDQIEAVGYLRQIGAI